MADHEALEEQLSCLRVVLVNLLQDFFGVHSLAQVPLERDPSELKFVLGQRASLIAEDVVDTAELFGELHALDLARGDIAGVFLNTDHVRVSLDELRHDDLTQLSVNDQVKWHQPHQHQEKRQKAETNNGVFVISGNSVLR